MRPNVLLAAVAAMSLPPLGSDATEIRRGSSEGAPMLYSVGGSGRPGKGKNRRPHHTSKRFVAMDKREARRRRRAR